MSFKIFISNPIINKDFYYRITKKPIKMCKKVTTNYQRALQGKFLEGSLLFKALFLIVRINWERFILCVNLKMLK